MFGTHRGIRVLNSTHKLYKLTINNRLRTSFATGRTGQTFQETQILHS